MHILEVKGDSDAFYIEFQSWLCGGNRHPLELSFLKQQKQPLLRL
jgi:hypothetical protein